MPKQEPSTTPVIKPIKTAEYTCNQSKYERVGKLPMRSLILGPSGTGKTVLISNLILDVYRNCFERIYIWSPSVHIDAAWRPVINYCTKELNQVEGKNEQFYFDNYNPEDLEHVINTQYKVVDFQKKNDYKDIYQILVVVDDFADCPSFTRKSPLLHSLYIRGRHLMVSSITATQVYKCISPIIRKNITAMFVFRLRNQADLDSFAEEFSAIFDKKIILQLYDAAIQRPHGFLFVNLQEHDRTKMFYSSFDKQLSVEEAPVEE